MIPGDVVEQESGAFQFNSFTLGVAVLHVREGDHVFAGRFLPRGGYDAYALPDVERPGIAAEPDTLVAGPLAAKKASGLNRDTCSLGEKQGRARFDGEGSARKDVQG